MDGKPTGPCLFFEDLKHRFVADTIRRANSDFDTGLPYEKSDFMVKVLPT